jgi:type IV pilus assembly protein PilM
MPSLSRSSRKRSSAPVGLDIDGRFLAAVTVDGNSVGRLASQELAPGVTEDGEVRDDAALTQALKDMFKANDLPKKVRLGISNSQIVVRHLEMPLIEDDKERDAAVRFQASEAIAMPLDQAVLDYQPIGASQATDGTVRQRVMVVAARESMVSRIVAAVKAAGLKPESVDLDAFALVRTLSEPGEENPDDLKSARVLCHLGGTTNLAIAAGPICFFTRALSTVWEAGGDASPGALAEEIRLCIDYHLAQPDARPVTEVVLSGPGAHDERLVEELGSRVGMPVSVAEPLGSLGTHAVPAGDDPFRYTVAAGLAMGAAA